MENLETRKKEKNYKNKFKTKQSNEEKKTRENKLDYR